MCVCVCVCVCVCGYSWLFHRVLVVRPKVTFPRFQGKISVQICLSVGHCVCLFCFVLFFYFICQAWLKSSSSLSAIECVGLQIGSTSFLAVTCTLGAFRYSPINSLEYCWDVKQPANKQTNSPIRSSSFLYSFIVNRADLSDPCAYGNHMEIDDYRRDVNNKQYVDLCDAYTLVPGWYRFFINGSSASMPTHCPPVCPCVQH